MILDILPSFIPQLISPGFWICYIFSIGIVLTLTKGFKITVAQPPIARNLCFKRATYFEHLKVPVDKNDTNIPPTTSLCVGYNKIKKPTFPAVAQSTEF